MANVSARNGKNNSVPIESHCAAAQKRIPFLREVANFDPGEDRTYPLKVSAEERRRREDVLADTSFDFDAYDLARLVQKTMYATRVFLQRHPPGEFERALGDAGFGEDLTIDEARREFEIRSAAEMLRGVLPVAFEALLAAHVPLGVVGDELDEADDAVSVTSK